MPIKLGGIEVKIALVSSTGGHLNELKRVIPAVKGYEFFIITEKSNMNSDLKTEWKIYYLNQQERKNLSFFKNIAINMFKSLSILFREKPKVIITTGAGVVFPICFFGKLIGSKVIYIESYAKISSPSLTGKVIYKFADEFYIQWESLRKYYPKAKYRGGLF